MFGIYPIYYKNRHSSPGGCGSVDWVQVCKLKGHQFDSQPGHMPGLQCFSHTSMFLSLCPSLPLSLKINLKNLFLKKDILGKNIPSTEVPQPTLGTQFEKWSSGKQCPDCPCPYIELHAFLISAWFETGTLSWTEGWKHFNYSLKEHQHNWIVNWGRGWEQRC